MSIKSTPYIMLHGTMRYVPLGITLHYVSLGMTHCARNAVPAYVTVHMNTNSPDVSNTRNAHCAGPPGRAAWQPWPAPGVGPRNAHCALDIIGRLSGAVPHVLNVTLAPLWAHCAANT